MTKQEQIEEMAKIVDEMYNVYTTTADDIADGLYNAGYRKIQDGTVVLSREEYEMLKSLYDTQKGAIMTSSIGDLPLTVEGLRKAVDEITRLNRVETELQELNAKYYNEAKDLRRELKQTRKETAKEIMQCLYDKCYEIQNLRECVAHITPLDILQLAKHYGVEVEE